MSRDRRTRMPATARRWVLVSLLFVGTIGEAGADGAAVQAPNFLIGFGTGDTYVDGRRTSNQFNLAGEATFPLGQFAGAMLQGGYGESNLATNPIPGSTTGGAWPDCSVRDERIGAGLFVRQPEAGRLGVEVAHGALQSRCNAVFLSTGDHVLRTDHAKATAEWYVGPVTLSADRGTTRLEGDVTLDTSTVALHWYPNRNWRLTASGDGYVAKETYRIGFEFQPVIIDNSLSLFVYYTTQRTDLASHTLMLGFNYFFETHVDLVSRDRRYR